MSNAIIYVFSGTKNTLITAHMIRNAFAKNDVRTVIYEVCKPYNAVPMPKGFDYVGFGYPIHAFNCPQFFLDFVSTLPDCHKKKAFIFKTSGEPFSVNNASSYLLYKTLRQKWFDVILEKHLLMPYNIMFRYKDSLVKQMYLYNIALCKQLTLDLLSGRKKALHYHLHHRFISAVFRIQWGGARLNGRIYSINKTKCTLCMHCIRHCPANNISIKNGKLHFNGSCAMCMRCVMYCPQNAINPGILRLWKVNGAYQYERIINDTAIRADFINNQTKGYFKLFKKYYQHAHEALSRSDIMVSNVPCTQDFVSAAMLSDTSQYIHPSTK